METTVYTEKIVTLLDRTSFQLQNAIFHIVTTIGYFVLLMKICPSRCNFFSFVTALLMLLLSRRYCPCSPRISNPLPMGHKQPSKPFKIFSLPVKKSNYSYRWNSLIFTGQKIWSPNFLFATSSISLKITCFYLDDTPNLSLSRCKKWEYLAPHTSLNSCSPKWSMLYLLLSNHHLSDVVLLSTSLFIPDITSFTCLINKSFVIFSFFYPSD